MFSVTDQRSVMDVLQIVFVMGIGTYPNLGTMRARGGRNIEMIVLVLMLIGSSINYTIVCFYSRAPNTGSDLWTLLIGELL